MENNLDDPRVTESRIRDIRMRPFLNAIYREWYDFILANIPEGERSVLEIGSGGSFLKDLRPSLVASDILRVSNVDVVLWTLAPSR